MYVLQGHERRVRAGARASELGRAWVRELSLGKCHHTTSRLVYTRTDLGPARLLRRSPARRPPSGGVRGPVRREERQAWAWAWAWTRPWAVLGARSRGLAPLRGRSESTPPPSTRAQSAGCFEVSRSTSVPRPAETSGTCQKKACQSSQRAGSLGLGFFLGTGLSPGTIVGSACCCRTSRDTRCSPMSRLARSDRCHG